MSFLKTTLVIAIATTVPYFAFAADMPAKAPPAPPAPVQNWTGFYVGGHVGYAWTNDPLQSEFDTSNFGGTANFFPNSFRADDANVIGGVHAGYNWQFAPTWLLGIEADFDWTSLKAEGGVAPMRIFPGGLPGVPDSAYTSSSRLNYFGTVRGRLGYIFSNVWMPYVTGGFAWGRVKYEADWVSVGPSPCCHAPVSFSDTKTGWVVGGGLEYKPVNSPWIFGVEYLYYNLGSATTAASIISANGAPLPPLPNPACVTSNCVFYSWDDLTVQTVRARFSYKF
jgi:outer membrane immunogenic protein